MMTTVCVSKTPGSVKEPLSVAVSPSLKVVLAKPRLILAGAIFLTVSCVLTLLLALSSSVTVTWTV